MKKLNKKYKRSSTEFENSRAYYSSLPPDVMCGNGTRNVSAGKAIDLFEVNYKDLRRNNLMISINNGPKHSVDLQESNKYVKEYASNQSRILVADLS